MRNIPERIFLNLGDDYPFDSDDFKELSEVTWSHDRINNKDIEYVRVKFNIQPKNIS